MTALSRSAVVRGPGCVYWNPGASQIVLPSVGGINAEVDVKEFEIKTDVDGVISRRVADVEGKISWTPLGILSSDVIGVLYPTAYRNPVLGSSVHGSSDTPALVHSVAGQKITFHSAALTRMPTLNLSADKPLYGAAEITAIRANGLEWSNAAALYTRASATYSAPNVAASTVNTQMYSAAWGDVFAAIPTESGWQIDFSLGLRPDPVDGYGTNDYLLESVGVIAKCQPKSLSESLIDELKVQGSGAGIGTERRRGKNLVITGTGIVVTLYDAVLQKGPLRWNTTVVRAGELAWTASRVESTGTYGALFAIALS